MSYADQVPSFSGWVRNGAGRSRITYRRRKEHSAAPERVQKKKIKRTHCSCLNTGLKRCLSRPLGCILKDASVDRIRHFRCYSAVPIGRFLRTRSSRSRFEDTSDLAFAAQHIPACSSVRRGFHSFKTEAGDATAMKSSLLNV